MFDLSVTGDSPSRSRGATSSALAKILYYVPGAVPSSVAPTEISKMPPLFGSAANVWLSVTSLRDKCAVAAISQATDCIYLTPSVKIAAILLKNP
jgi:hypothetical protein